LSSGKRFPDLIAEILRLPPADIVDSLNLDDTLTWDSLKHMEIIAGIEQEYAIELTEDEIVAMTSVGRMKDVLRNHSVQV
jgi:acyl carrier protein